LPAPVAGMSPSIRIRTLTDGGQQPLEIAHLVAEFIDAAQRSLDLAQYDFNLGPETAEIVGGAIRGAHARGVAVRVIYNVDHANPIPVPPPPEPDVALIESLGVPAKAIAGVPDLMHHKFVVRDGATVWTGSMNWTDDSWSRQENVVLTVESEELAGLFTADFDGLWKEGNVETSGRVPPKRVRAGEVLVRPWFTPGYGEDMSQRIARTIARAKRRVRICSPVISASAILSVLAQVVSERSVDIGGCVDATQVAEVIHQWRENGNVEWKSPLLRTTLTRAPFSGKRSTPYTPDSVHDYMHAKVTVVDDLVLTGSYNLSHSGEENAENLLELRSPALADFFAGFIEQLYARYAVDPVTVPK